MAVDLLDDLDLYPDKEPQPLGTWGQMAGGFAAGLVLHLLIWGFVNYLSSKESWLMDMEIFHIPSIGYRLHVFLVILWGLVVVGNLPFALLGNTRRQPLQRLGWMGLLYSIMVTLELAFYMEVIKEGNGLWGLIESLGRHGQELLVVYGADGLSLVGVLLMVRKRRWFWGIGLLLFAMLSLGALI